MTPNDFVKEHLPLARYLANRMWLFTGKQYDFHCFESAATLELWRLGKQSQTKGDKKPRYLSKSLWWRLCNEAKRQAAQSRWVKFSDMLPVANVAYSEVTPFEATIEDYRQVPDCDAAEVVSYVSRGLTGFEKEVVLQHTGWGETFAEIAITYNCRRQWPAHVYARAMQKMRRAAKKLGLHA